MKIGSRRFRCTWRRIRSDGIFGPLVLSSTSGVASRSERVLVRTFTINTREEHNEIPSKLANAGAVIP